MTTGNRPYEIITSRILAELEKGQVPWRKPWKPGMRPQNAVSKRAYGGVNSIILGTTSYSDPRWVTFKNAMQLGGHVKKGEKGTHVIFWKLFPVKDVNTSGEIRDKTIPLLRYYTIFNVEQCEGLELLLPIEVPIEFDPIDAAEKIVSSMLNPPSISHDGGDRAYYSPLFDAIHLPERSQFNGAEEYYCTTFHELGQSTGHETRLSRDSILNLGPFGSPIYSREELVAEFSAAFLCGEVGVENTISNSSSYIQGWSRALKDDPRLFIVAASQGEKAADLILGKKGEKGGREVGCQQQ